MASDCSSSIHWASRNIPHPLAPGAAGFTALLLSLCVAFVGCDRQPTAPDNIRLLTVSGFVYERAIPGSGSGEPVLAGVLITVRDEDGSSRTSTSDPRGFYTVEVSPGTIAMTASKNGYTSVESIFGVAHSTLLNFGLSRDSGDV